MSSLFQARPSAVFPRLPRSIFCVLLIFFLFATFFVLFLPPAYVPRFSDALHFPTQHPSATIRPLTFTSPSHGSHRHRIKTQRPLTDHRKGDIWAQRADAVRKAFSHALNSYVTYAAPHDELRPLSKTAIDNFHGWSLTYIDSLDTMWIMGLYEEFDTALAVVANTNFSMPSNEYASFFETVIRHLGGLLSAYALSQDPIVLLRADDLGSALMSIFDTPFGLPADSINTVTGDIRGWDGPRMAWVGGMSCQLEFKYLAYLTGRTSYYTAVEKVMEIMYKTDVSSSADLFPIMWSLETGSPIPTSTYISVGALADSGYEYMLKQWLLSGRTDTQARDLYMRSANAILDHLTYITPKRNLLYATRGDVDSNGHLNLAHDFEHLTCFLPGVLALGAATLSDAPQTHLWAAKGLANTCWALYADSATGLSPDAVAMHQESSSADGSPWDGRWVTHLARWESSGARGDPPGVRSPEPVSNETLRDYTPINVRYPLRPETVETFFVLWRTTGDIMWRERGWSIFEALIRESRVEDGGFASVLDVNHAGGEKYDEMPSFFLAETLKYLFLLFSEDDVIPLNQWVFNTEAHPLPVLHWSEWEMERLAIPHNTSVDRKL
ncbi:seven-hairpin glycosidase [Russula dissimulans]|nr:seven-hairpin glycosidase [Russula dissimulans]